MMDVTNEPPKSEDSELDESETALMAGTIIASGECGADVDNVTWTLDSEGTLTISGTGKMKDYALHLNRYSPWYGDLRIKSIYICDGVTSIGEGAFRGCSSLTSLTIPDSIDEIAYGTFMGCIGLTNAGPIGGSYAYQFGWTKTIPDCAFSNCVGLTSVTIPNSIVSIGASAFSDCVGLTNVTIPDSVTSIGDSAFIFCDNLKSVIIPYGVTSIGNGLFGYCSGLTSVTIPNSVTSIEEGAFLECSGLTNVTIPNSVTSIGGYAFYNCSDLTSVTIPNSVTSIGGYAFYNCSKLTNATVPNGVTKIVYHTFERCVSLSSVTIGNSVASIGQNAFSGCTSLTSIIMADSIVEIQLWAFSNCSNLTDVYYSGSREQWNAISISNANDNLKSATIHYNSTGSYKPDGFYFSNASAMILTSQNTAQNRAYFDFFVGCNVTDETVLPDGGLDTVMGKYAMVELDRRTSPYKLLKVTALDDSRLGRVSDITDSTITIDGTEYPLKAKVSLPDYVIGEEVIYHLYQGTVVYLHYPTEATGRLTEWDGIRNQVVINWHGSYMTNYLTDMSFLGHIDQLIGWNVKYLGVNGYILRITQIADEQEETKQYQRYDAAARWVYFTDGTGYAVGNGVTLSVNGLRESSWVTCTIRTTPDEGAHIVKMEQRADMAPYRILVGDQKLTVGKKNTVYARISTYPREQAIPNDPIDSVEWIIEDKGVAAFDKNGQTGSVTHSMNGQSLTKLAGNSRQSVDSIKIYAVSSGKTNVTCTMRSGEQVTTETFHITVFSKETEELMNRVTKWRTAYEKYINALKSKMAKEGDSEKVTSIEEQADELWNADKASNAKFVTFLYPGNENDKDFRQMRQYVYQAVVMFLRDKSNAVFSTKNIKVSDISDPIKFGNQVAMEVLRMMDYNSYPYEFKQSDSDSKVSILIEGASYGSVNSRYIYYDGKWVAYLTNPPDEIREVISSFIQELLTLEQNLVRQAYKELLKDVFPTDIKTLANKTAKDKITEILTPCNNALMDSGYGNVLQGLKNCFDYYEHLKGVIELGNQLSSGAMDIDKLLGSSLTLMEEVEFESESIQDWSISWAMDAIKRAKNALDEWLKKIADKDETTRILYEIYQIAYEFRCPVSVSVYNSSGTQIGYVGDDDLWYDEDAIYIEHYGDAKTVYSYGEPLTFDVTGTDSGALNCTVEEYDGGEAVGRLNYYDIPLYDGKQISLAASGESATDASITLMSEGATIAADESLTADEYEASTVSVSCSANIAAGGELWGGGDYVRGDAVTLQAITEDGYVFLGWRMGNGALASASPVYEFTAREDVALTALFGEYEAETSNSLTAIRGADSRTGSGTVNVTATVYCADGVDATAYCAFYDGDGRLLSVDVETLTGGEDNSLSFESRDVSAHAAKIIVFSGQRIPLCA
ncbi:MAG: leucine-rich repeat domain-containing protein, partial [Oscillibacter sp.]|nr:leucine-rich repeat domain-containing protein [Oscillibacter sp.]